MHSMLSTHCVEQSFDFPDFDAHDGSRSHRIGSRAAARSSDPQPIHASNVRMKRIGVEPSSPRDHRPRNLQDKPARGTCKLRPCEQAKASDGRLARRARDDILGHHEQLTDRGSGRVEAKCDARSCFDRRGRGGRRAAVALRCSRSRRARGFSDLQVVAAPEQERHPFLVRATASSSVRQLC